MDTHATLYGPGELLATIEPLLGFRPRESIVIVALRDTGELGLMMRVDRADCLIPEVAAPMGRAVAGHLTRDGALDAVMVTYTEDDVRLSCGGADALRPHLETAVRHLDHWAVRDGRFFSPGCADDQCCPPQGLEVPEPPVPVTAHATPRRARHGSPATRHTVDADARRRAGRAASRWWTQRRRDPQAWRRRSADKWSEALGAAVCGLAAPEPPGAGTLAASLRDVTVRDAVIMMVVAGGPQAAEEVLSGDGDEEVARAFDEILAGGPEHRPDPEWIETLVGLCEHVAAHASRSKRAPALSIAALLWWWHGDARLALDACERALSDDPEYRLAELVGAAIRCHLGPQWTVSGSADDSHSPD